MARLSGQRILEVVTLEGIVSILVAIGTNHARCSRSFKGADIVGFSLDGVLILEGIVVPGGAVTLAIQLRPGDVCRALEVLIACVQGLASIRIKDEEVSQIDLAAEVGIHITGVAGF